MGAGVYCVGSQDLHGEPILPKTSIKGRADVSGSPHAEHRVDVAADSLDVGGHQVGLGGLQARVLHHWLHGAEDALRLVGRVQVGHVTGVQDAVHVLQE